MKEGIRVDIKKIISFLLIFTLVCSLMIIVNADGDYCEFNINGFEYHFWWGDTSDEWNMADNSMLVIESYNGDKCIDIRAINFEIPKGLFVYQILDAASIPQTGWEKHLDEFIPVNTDRSIKYYDSEQMIGVIANKTQIDFLDQKPVIISGRTMLPIRSVAEVYNWEVIWNEEEKIMTTDDGLKYRYPKNSVTLKSAEKEINLEIGREDMTVRNHNEDGSHTLFLDVPSLIINGRTMLPVRAVCEALDINVEWDDKNQQVILSR